MINQKKMKANDANHKFYFLIMMCFSLKIAYYFVKTEELIIHLDRFDLFFLPYDFQIFMANF